MEIALRKTYELEELAMKPLILGLFCVLLQAGVAAAPNGDAESVYKAMFIKHWQVSKEFTLAVAEAMPAEQYNFKATAEQMSFGQLMIHIATQNSDSCATATGTKAPLSMPSSIAELPATATDKQTAIRFLTISFDTCAKELEAMPPDQWNKEVYKFQGHPVLASEALWYTFTHTAHHRAHAEVYLRLKNIKPPAWRF